MRPEFVLVILAAALTAAAATPLVRAIARRANLIAKPVADRWHEQPTPLFGGVAIYLGFIVGMALAVWQFGIAYNGFPVNWRIVGLVSAATLMFLIGLVDDRFKLRPATKLIGQGMAAGILIVGGAIYEITPWPQINVVITVFWFIGLTNALNLLDNMDGVAAGVAGIAAAFLGVTFVLDDSPLYAATCFALSAALFGFLPYNFRPATIFMGDSGSLLIGALLAGLGAIYPTTATASIVSVMFVPAVIVVIPLLDTMLVTVARTLAGRSISVGGRDHSTHRLAAMGLSQRGVALLLYGFAIAGGLLALILRGTPTTVGLPIGALFLVAMLIGAAYLGKLHSYDDTDAPKGRVTLLVSNLLHKRRAFEVMLDLILFGVSYQVAYLLRWDFSLPPAQYDIFVRTLAVAMAAKSVAFGLFGVYRGHWHQLSAADVPRLAAASGVGALLTLGGLVFLFPTGGYARSIIIIDAMMAALLTMGARVSFRLLGSVRRPVGAPALIFGAGRAGELALREMLSNARLGLRPMGFLDDDARKRGRLIQGYPVLGSLADVATVVEHWGVRTIVVGVRTPDEGAVGRLREECERMGVDLLQLHVEFQMVTPPRNEPVA